MRIACAERLQFSGVIHSQIGMQKEERGLTDRIDSVVSHTKNIVSMTEIVYEAMYEARTWLRGRQH